MHHPGLQPKGRVWALAVLICTCFRRAPTRRAPDDASIAELRHRLESKGLTVRIPTEEDTALAGAAKPALVVECDAAVTGSGAGGSAAAAVLAAAGRRVVVVEKSTWQPAANLTLQEASSLATMYERGGLMATEDSSVIIMAGSTLGGGPTINWVRGGPIAVWERCGNSHAVVPIVLTLQESTLSSLLSASVSA